MGKVSLMKHVLLFGSSCSTTLNDLSTHWNMKYFAQNSLCLVRVQHHCKDEAIV